MQYQKRLALNINNNGIISKLSVTQNFGKHMSPLCKEANLNALHWSFILSKKKYFNYCHVIGTSIIRKD